ncbi:MAG: sulfate permease SulP family, partial [Halothiobacillaceae bacterium]
MPHRSYLFSLRIAHALRESCISESYTLRRLSKDLLAGVTVGIIAIPLAMALAIASGVPPQYGLYTAVVAGLLIPLLGGSRYSISGPTAAFVVVLAPITHHYGLGGLLLATLLSGGILISMALLRLGRFIAYIPEAVTLGFTAGIAVVIASLQIKDLLGLQIATQPEHFIDKMALLASHLGEATWPSMSVALVTLAMLLLWPRLRTPIPAHLPAIIGGALVAWLLSRYGFSVDTIGSRFSYLLPDGTTGHGIPPYLPHWVWPWSQPGPDGAPLTLDWKTLRDLLPAAFAIAMLGAIESLLCAVILDGITGKRHSANSELLGQGIGNIVTPFFGGITATAAIARSVANFRAGAESPLSGVIHALVVLLGLIALAPLLAYLPMAAMAALLLIVAWNMSEMPKALHLLKTSPRGDIWVFITCFALTVLFDMVLAITAGIVIAALLFIKEIAEMTKVTDISEQRKWVPEPLPPHWGVYKISGPLFFAAADRIFGELSLLCAAKSGIILHMEGVTLLDAGGLAALTKLIAKCEKSHTQLVLT